LLPTPLPSTPPERRLHNVRGPRHSGQGDGKPRARRHRAINLCLGDLRWTRMAAAEVIRGGRRGFAGATPANGSQLLSQCQLQGRRGMVVAVARQPRIWRRGTAAVPLFTGVALPPLPVPTACHLAVRK
jgi:hypothetical protein